MGLFSHKQKKFLLEPTRFIYGDATYSYGDIKHIGFVQSRTDVRMNFIPVDEVNESYLELTLRDGGKVKVAEKMYLIGFSQDKSQILSDLFDAFVFLSKVTFSSRLSYYTDQLQRLGYFVYAEAKFFPHKSIVMPSGERISIGEHEFFMSGYWIRIKPKSTGGFFNALMK